LIFQPKKGDKELNRNWHRASDGNRSKIFVLACLFFSINKMAAWMEMEGTCRL
jgi:hypothetical protein